MLDILRTGAYGVVALVEDRDTEALYAAKIIKPGYLQNEVTYLQILSADPDCSKYMACYVNHFKHLDYSTKEFRYVIVTEYLEQETLAVYKKNHPRANWPLRLAAMLDSLLGGLDFMHSKGIVHGDIRPENLVFRDASKYNTLVFTEFGSACKDCEEENVGSRDLWAPELIVSMYAGSGKPTPATDVWRAAISLYLLFMKPIWIVYASPGWPAKFDAVKFAQAKEAMKWMTAQMDEKHVTVFEKMVEIDPKKRITAKEALAFLRGTSTE